MKISSILKQMALIGFLVYLVVALYVATSCQECRFYDLSAVRLVLIVGVFFCIIRISFVVYEAYVHRVSWLQTIVPCFVLTQLILLLYDVGSSVLLLGIVAVVEIGFVVAGIVLVKRAAATDESFQVAILRILGPLLPSSILKWVKLEISLLSSALYGVSKLFWLPEKPGWSYWKNSAFPLIFVLVFFVGPVELFVLWYLIRIESAFVHSLFALLFIWSIMYVYGFWVSVRLSPHQLSKDEISLSRGVLGRAVFPTSLIKSLRVVPPKLIGEEEERDREAVFLTVPGTPTVELILKEPVEVSQLFFEGLSSTNVIVVSVDEPQLFCQEISRLSDT